MKGVFITFEGPDGAGKTTQIKSLAQALKRGGHDVIVTREPGGTAISDHIRSLLLSTDYGEMADQTEVLLYAASRAQHVHDIIKPALWNGRIILCDRFVDASIAYQAYGLGVDETIVRQINAYASGGIRPHRTYMLDISVEESRRRLHHRALQHGEAQMLDRIEQKEAAYHERVRQGFLTIAAQEQDRVLLLDANREFDAIEQDIMLDCEHLLAQFNMNN